MLKISQIESVNQDVTLRLEGRMVGPWVPEARETCEKLLKKGRMIKLDLTEVLFVDPEGIKFLKRLISGGVTLAGCSLFVKEQLRSAKDE
jgi:hypothetical protein